MNSIFSALMLAASLAASPAVPEPAIEGLPQEVPRTGTVITVDVSAHTIYLFQDGQLVQKSLAGTGMDKLLKKGSRIWLFRTPRGRHTVVRKVVDPIWTKPDWAFVEEGKKVPAADSPQRKVKGKMGRYALDLGEGILIHGTDDPTSFGRKASHGCIRVQNKMLKLLYQSAAVGTDVYIFDSKPTLTFPDGTGPERSSHPNDPITAR